MSVAGRNWCLGKASIKSLNFTRDLKDIHVGVLNESVQMKKIRGGITKCKFLSERTVSFI